MDKKKLIPFLRRTTQVLGLLLTALGFFYQLPLVTGLLIGSAFLVGPLFCGWICPYGTLQDFAARLGTLFGIKKILMPTMLQKILRPARYVLYAIVFFATADFIFQLLSFDPRANFSNLLNSNTLSFFGWVIILFFLVISLFFERPFCNYLCIEGAKYGLFSLTRIFTVVRNEESCISCNKCSKVCPMTIDVAKASQVRSPQCINCFECIAQCPVKKTLEYKFVPLHKKHQKIMAALFLFFGLGFSFFYLQASVTGESIFVAYLYQDTPSDEESAITIEIIDATQALPSETLTNEETTDIISSANDASGIADGTYEGSSTGFRGEMVVGVTVESELITAVEIISSRDDQRWLDRAYNGVSSSILEEQTVDVDSISGATYSSVAIMNAVKDALEHAGGANVSDVSTPLPTGGKRH